MVAHDFLRSELKTIVKERGFEWVLRELSKIAVEQLADMEGKGVTGPVLQSWKWSVYLIRHAVDVLGLLPRNV